MRLRGPIALQQPAEIAEFFNAGGQGPISTSSELIGGTAEA
jgi:hypothetical protein